MPTMKPQALQWPSAVIAALLQGLQEGKWYEMWLYRNVVCLNPPYEHRPCHISWTLAQKAECNM